MNPLLIAVILATVSLSAGAQIALKVGVTTPRVAAAINKGGSAVLSAAATSPFIWLGLLIYGVSVLAWLWVLSKVDVSAAYPFVGVSFLLTTVIGAIYLHETVSPLRAFGTVLIVLGCTLVARSVG